MSNSNLITPFGGDLVNLVASADVGRRASVRKPVVSHLSRSRSAPYATWNCWQREASLRWKGSCRKPTSARSSKT